MPAYTQLIPSSELSAGQAAAIRNEVINKLVQLAVSQLNVTADKLVVRDIRPATDLDFGTEDWYETTGTTTGAFETMTTGTMGDERFVGIYGVKDDPDAFGSVSQIRFNIGGGDRAFWTLQSLNEEDGFVGLSPAGVLISQNTPYTIARYVVRASRAAHLVLKGVVVEPRGRTVSP